jgi:hypothetical protein
MNRPTCRAAGLVFALVGACTLGAATYAAEGRGTVDPWVWNVAGGAVYQFDADLADSQGQLSVGRGFVQAGLGYAWNQRTSISLSFGAGRSDYDFSPRATIDGEQPWDRIEDYRISVPLRLSPTERSSVIVIPSIRTSAATNASLKDGITKGVLAGVSWDLSESLSIGPGLGWFSEIDGGSSVFPILLIDWKIADKWRLNTGQGLAASQGPGLTLNYQLTERWTLALTGRYERTRFALGDNAGQAGSIGEDKGVPLMLMLDYSPWPMTSFSAAAGVKFEGSLKLEDERGRRIARSDFETAPVIGVAFTSRF